MFFAPAVFAPQPTGLFLHKFAKCHQVMNSVSYCHRPPIQGSEVRGRHWDIPVIKGIYSAVLFMLLSCIDSVDNVHFLYNLAEDLYQ